MDTKLLKVRNLQYFRYSARIAKLRVPHEIFRGTFSCPEEVALSRPSALAQPLNR